MPANTAIADAADFQHTEMPANTAIADFADFADFFLANDRANAGTAPRDASIPRYCRFADFQHTEMPGNTAIADFADFFGRSHIDASHSRQPLVKGERMVRYEVNAVIVQVAGDTTLMLRRAG